MISSIQNIYRTLRDRSAGAADPVGFARSLGVSIGSGVHFYGIDRGMFGSEPWMIRIGDNSHITAGVQFITHDGGTLVLRKEVPDLEWSAPITVGSDVYIGMRTIILPGVNIGNRCIIGAGTIVTKSIPENCVVAGVPGRVIKSTDVYLQNLKVKSLRCGHLKGNAKDQILRDIYPEFGKCKR